MARVPLAGTNYIPGVSEENALEEIKRLLERNIENPIDYLAPPVETTAAGGEA
jgi:methylamine---glutamate N-methyltransferase subunit C